MQLDASLRVVVLLAFVLSCRIAHARAAGEHSIDVKGIVTDEQGEPVADATVQWIQPSAEVIAGSRRASYEVKQAVRTNADGRFELRAANVYDKWGAICVLAPGKAQTIMPGYLPPGEPPQFVDINNVRRTEPWIVLNEGATLNGTIVDDDGKPVAGARVGKSYMLNHAVTDADGRFSLPNFTKFGHGRAHVDRAPLLEGDDFVRQWAREPMEQADNVRIVVQRGGLIEGRVTMFDSGKGVPGVRVHARARGQIDEISAVTDADGRYRIRTLTGSVQVTVSPPHPEYRKPPLDGRDWIATEPSQTVPIEKGETVTDVDFVLRPALTVTGFVRTHDGEVPPVLLDIRVHWSDLDGAGRRQGDVAFVTTKPDGSFELPKLPAGRFVAGVSVQGDRMQQVGHQPFEIDKWEDFHGLEITLSGDPECLERLNAAAEKAATQPAAPEPQLTMLRGHVVNASGQPARMARVVVIDLDDDGKSTREYIPDLARSDVDGRFEVKQRDRAHRLMVIATDARRENACAMQLDTNWADQPPKLVLDRKASRITGTVRDQADAPLAGVPVRLYYHQAIGERAVRHIVLSETITDDAGRYELTGITLPAGDLPLRLSSARRDSEVMSPTATRRFALREDEWYARFPIAPGETLADMDFVQDRSDPQHVVQRVTRADLAERRGP